MRLIDADELKRHKVHSREFAENVVSVAQIDWQPTIEAEPRKPGRWEVVHDNNGVHHVCSYCGEWRYHSKQLYCGNCGAKLDGITDDVAEEIIKAASKACANCQEFVCDECEYRHWRTR